MKPRTKIQREVMSLSSKLHNLGKRDYDWARKNAFYNVAFQRGKRKFWCSECGALFESDKEPHSCPHCKARFKEVEKTLRKEDGGNRAYMVFADVIDRWQVLRYVKVTKRSVLGKRAIYSYWEIMQLWFTQGHYEVVARQRGMGMYVDTFMYNSNLEIRKVGLSFNGPLTIEDIPYSDIRIKKLLPYLQGLNFVDEKCNGMERKDIYRIITSYPMAETLFKKGYGNELYRMSRRGVLNKDYFTAFKIALRNHYDIKQNFESWLDMIHALLYLRKDIHNPFYVAPKDFWESHNRWVGLMQKKIAKDESRRVEHQLIMEAMRSKQIAERYEAERKRFMGMKLSDGTVVIQVLPNVEAFRQEASEMHHCVFTNKYYEKMNSLIMSATVDNVREETVEVDLNDYSIVQSRGKYNKPTEYHDEIISLVNSSMNEIRELNKAI